MIRAIVDFVTGGSLARLVATLLVGLALGAWSTWRVQEWRHQKLQLDQVNKQAAADRAARVDEMVRVRNAERIADEDARRSAATAKRLASASAALGRLQHDIARLNAGDLPKDPGLAAFAREARAARDLLGRCADRYRRMDERAKQLGDQVTGLQAFAADVCRAGQPVQP